RWPLGPGGRHGRRREELLQPVEDVRPLALLDGLQPAELQSGELDAAFGPHGQEAKVGQEIAREDRAMDEEALVRRLALRIAIRERLERLRTPVPRIPDCGEEE